MAELNRAGQSGSLGDIDITQGDIRKQFDALTDTVRQLGGNPDVTNDPLSAPYVLYVDPNIGSDTFVTGDYKTTPNSSYEDKMRRISLQRLECGYSISRPFRTLNRAIIEAGIISSRDYLTLGNICGDLISIVLAPGLTTVLNDPGAGTTEQWTDGMEPTDADLIAFNPQATGGLILPRGCSLISMDLRKTVLRPNVVPPPAVEAADYSNRRAIFKMTGGGYYSGFTVLDKIDADASHHLLDVFQLTSKAELDEFYTKIRSSFSGIAGINDDFAVSRNSETQLVGPSPSVPIEAVDTVGGASPYILNVSLRSEWGMCGLMVDGARVSGRKSVVLAQYTAVSLQRDESCWQRYTGGSWNTITDYNELIAADPDNIRMDPERLSFHVRAVNDAIIQEVSIFAIGQGCHHLAQNGGAITLTNSNSNFGGCSAIAQGIRSQAAPADGPWSIKRIERSLDPFQKTNNIRKIYLGTVDSLTSNQLNLEDNLSPSFRFPDQPDVLVRENYTLKEGDYIWIENNLGPDYRTQLAASPWGAANPDEINTKAPFVTDNTDGNVAPGTGDRYADAPGLRVFVRRLRDVRTVEERTTSLIWTGENDSKRQPVRDYSVQPVSGTDWTNRMSSIILSQNSNEVPGNTVKSQLNYTNRPENETDFDRAIYYRPGDLVRQNNKHYTAVNRVYDVPFDTNDWSEMYVHMPEAYDAEGYYKHQAPLIIFNGDEDQSETSDTLGFTLSDAVVQAQITSAIDYQGLRQLLINLGRSDGQVRTHLTPQTLKNRLEDVSGLGFQPVEMRRPSNVRMFGHAYEWAGFGQYSKGLPQYQGTMTPTNKFSYYFTNVEGGKVYASGFNEEGLQVTPRGIEDITTGNVVGFEEVGNPDQVIFEFNDDEYLHTDGRSEHKVGALSVGGTQSNPRQQFTSEGILFRPPTQLQNGATLESSAFRQYCEGVWYPELMAVLKPDSNGLRKFIQDLNPPQNPPLHLLSGTYKRMGDTVTGSLTLSANGQMYPWTLGTVLYFKGLPFKQSGDISGQGFGDAVANFNIYSYFVMGRDYGSLTADAAGNQPALGADFIINVDAVGPETYDNGSVIIGFTYTIGEAFTE